METADETEEESKVTRPTGSWRTYLEPLLFCGCFLSLKDGEFYLKSKLSLCFENFATLFGRKKNNKIWG